MQILTRHKYRIIKTGSGSEYRLLQGKRGQATLSDLVLKSLLHDR